MFTKCVKLVNNVYRYIIHNIHNIMLTNLIKLLKSEVYFNFKFIIVRLKNRYLIPDICYCINYDLHSTIIHNEPVGGISVLVLDNI